MSDMIWLSDSMCFGKKVSLQSRRKMKKCCWVEFGQTRGICISKAGVTHNLGNHKKHRRTDSIPRHKWDPTVSMSVMDRIWVQHPSVTKTYSQHKSTSFHTHLFPQPTQINIFSYQPFPANTNQHLLVLAPPLPPANTNQHLVDCESSLQKLLRNPMDANGWETIR